MKKLYNTVSAIVMYDDGSYAEVNCALDDIHEKFSSGHETWKEYDNDGNEIHYTDSDGYEEWTEYNDCGRLTYYKDSKRFGILPRV